MKWLIFLLIFVCTLSCSNNEKVQKLESTKMIFPNHIPEEFKYVIDLKDKIIHRGSFSTENNRFFYTVSDKEFKKFDIEAIELQNGQWINVDMRHINSKYSEHGLSFSAKSNIFFSSTRPTKELESGVWRLWKVVNDGSHWSKPELIEIPNLEGRHISHPSESLNGNLYFHSSKLDYSDMKVYFSKLENGKYGDAIEIKLKDNKYTGYCTPYISPDEKFIIYAGVGQELELNISYSQGDEQWSSPERMPSIINTRNQGNPTMSKNGKYLLYTKEKEKGKMNWTIEWVKTENLISY